MGKECVVKCPYNKAITKKVLTERVSAIVSTQIVASFAECIKNECPFYDTRCSTDYNGLKHSLPICKRAEREVK